MNHSHSACGKASAGPRRTALRGGALALALMVVLTGCGKKEAGSGQALVSVNGEEITALQLNEELQRAGVPAAQQAQARKQLLESLIDRQLLLNEANREKLDRDPKVVQAIERAKAQIIAQAYLQKRLAAAPRPTKSELQAYFDKHPELFVNRKQFELRQLVLATKDLGAEAQKVIDGAKTLDEVSAWFDANGVKFARNQIVRTSADLPPALAEKLGQMTKGQLFIIREGERSVLSTVVDVKDTPVDFAASSAQIEQFLINTKNKEGAAAELARLRAAAKIDYLNKGALDPAAPAAAPAAPAAAPAAAGPDAAAAARGVAGLK